MTLRSLVVIMALGCSGPATTSSTTPTDPTPVTTTEPPPATPPVPPPPMTDKELETVDASSPARGTSSSQAAIAAKLNEDGRTLMTAKKFSEASSKFREAFARIPDAAYAFNLCRSLYQEGKFNEALTACHAVEKETPPPSIAAQATAMIERIKAEARAQNIDLH